jgi:hypothetical protein
LTWSQDLILRLLIDHLLPLHVLDHLFLLDLLLDLLLDESLFQSSVHLRKQQLLTRLRMISRHLFNIPELPLHSLLDISSSLTNHKRSKRRRFTE